MTETSTTETTTYTINLAGSTFEFEPIDRAGMREVTVTFHMPTPEVHTFLLPANTDPMSYALGYWHCRVRDVRHLL